MSIRCFHDGFTLTRLPPGVDPRGPSEQKSLVKAVINQLWRKRCEDTKMKIQTEDSKAPSTTYFVLTAATKARRKSRMESTTAQNAEAKKLR